MSAKKAPEVARPVLLEQPEFCPGAYDLHLYCKYSNPDHRWDEFPHVSEGCQTYGEAARDARKAGWILHRDRTATCPKCAKALRTTPGDPNHVG